MQLGVLSGYPMHEKSDIGLQEPLCLTLAETGAETEVVAVFFILFSFSLPFLTNGNMLHL